MAGTALSGRKKDAISRMTPGEPPRPSTIDTDARLVAYWLRYCEDLALTGRLYVEHASILTDLCRVSVLLDVAYEEWASTGYTMTETADVRGGGTSTRVSPYISAVDRLHARKTHLLDRCGLTPVYADRVPTSAGGKDTTNGWGELLTTTPPKQLGS